MLEVYEQTGLVRQTAKMLHCSKNTVKCWIHKSRKQPDVPLEFMAKRKKTKLGFKSISPLIEKKIMQQLEKMARMKRASASFGTGCIVCEIPFRRFKKPMII